MKAIVLGGVAAGMSAASKLKREKPDADITVYERGSFLSYGACGLPYYIGGFNAEAGKLIARTREQYDQMGIRTCLRHEALLVDPVARSVQVKNHDTGETFWDAYDALMIAVGCDTVMPGVPGANLPSVFYVKTMEDGLLFERIAHLKGVNEVVIVGGGYIGVEMAEAMLHLNKQVTLVEASERLLAPFEPEFSEMAAQELERKGVTLRLKERVTAFEEAGDSRTVRTDRGEYRADAVLVAIGVKPATAFLAQTGIAMARNGAIVVDRQQRTSLPDVFSAGDCAVCWHRVAHENYFLPLGTVANKCGRIAGANMAGAHEEFEGALGTAAIKVCDLEMCRTGLSEADAARKGLDFAVKLVTSNDRPAYYPNQTKLVIKLLYDRRTLRLLGANIAGEKGAVLRGDIFATAIHAGLTTPELGMVDLAYAPPFASVWDAVHIAANAAK
ncbi:MAG TPA: CoA-disulfide reductase [Candidatus Limiplasma sp.]|nr:CoA-disulfide reductase [Candidatus Limiplasma sp.]HPS81660.1 CoA-disulfide reductase [Candidatus Limiplasma sp.]